ncbi:MAG: sugar ABC transporter substrate-binding protein [Anaerolineae bacterium]
MKIVKALLLVLLVTAVVLTGCAAPAQPTSAPAPTNTPVPPTAAPAPTNTPAAVEAPTQAPGSGEKLGLGEDAYPRPPKPSKQYTIGVLVPHLSNPHFVGQAYGYIDEAEKLGAKVILYEAGGYQYLDKQIAQMEDLIASKVDAIILVAVNGPGTVQVVEEAVAAGIPVINCNVMTDSDKVVTRIRSDDEVIGQMQADFMGEALKGKGNVVMLRGPAGTSWAENRGNAFKARIAEKYPGIQIVGEQYMQSSPDQGLRVMEDFLQTYSQIDGVYNGADNIAIGAAQAVVAAGKAGQIVITTTDFQPDCEKFVREGVISAAVVQQTVVIGRWGIRAAINYLEGREVPKALWTPLLLVTKDNVDQVDFSGVRAPDGWKPPVAH